MASTTASVGEQREAQGSSCAEKAEILQSIALLFHLLRRATTAGTLTSMVSKPVLCI